MADEASSQEKTEEATPRKREEARKKGTVAKSTEINGAAVMLALAILMPSVVAYTGQNYIEAIRNGLSHLPHDLHPGSMGRYFIGIVEPAVIIMAPIMGTIMVVSLFTNFTQVGFKLSPEAMKPSFEKLNIMKGFQRLLSMKSAVEAVKTVVKTGLFGYIAWNVIWSHRDELQGLPWLPPVGAISIVGGMIWQILLRIGIAWMVVAALDYFFQRKQIDKQLRMTKDELKREMKEQETSPELKAAIHQRRRQLSKSRVNEQVPTADAVITNPTHYAVAIKYERNKHHAPIVVAKGADFLAQKIREIAKENRVPIVPNPPLARSLYKKCEVGDYVPKELYQKVAEVLAYVYKTLKRVK